MRGLFIHSEWVVRFIGSHGLDNSLQVGGDWQQCEMTSTENNMYSISGISTGTV